MITIIYDPLSSSPAVKDGEVEKIVDDIEWVSKDSKNHVVSQEFSNGLVIYEIRARIAEGKINHENIQFKVNDKIIKIDEFGCLDSNPDGFCDQSFHCARRILRARFPKKKKIKK